ncbi:predicted GPI-anchored protein 58, partial [Austrofundulus limnaeus]|uniref:Predicted GPI-anchored protein 58 n=1 Tax=Austrofundulus limnaeus TaxID=52670 RepID=A0A2I4BYD5_AUSLI
MDPCPRAAQTPKTRPPAPQPTGSPKKLPKPSKSDLAESAHPATDNTRRDQGQAPSQQRGQPAGPAQPATATTAIHPAPPQKKYYTHPIIQTTHRTYSTLDTQAGLAYPLPRATSPVPSQPHPPASDPQPTRAPGGPPARARHPGTNRPRARQPTRQAPRPPRPHHDHSPGAARPQSPKPPVPTPNPPQHSQATG